MVPRPHHFFDVAHIDITYGDTVAPGEIKFALLIADTKNRYNYCIPLTDCKEYINLNGTLKVESYVGEIT